LYFGISKIDLKGEHIAFSRGVTLTPTFAHLMTPMVMAFSPPTSVGHHPGPWIPVDSLQGTDINAQLAVPLSADQNSDDGWMIATTIISLIRLKCDPAASLVAYTDMPFGDVRNQPYPIMRIVPI